MAISNINRQNIIDVLKYIDENGVPFLDHSTQYDFVLDDGKKYPYKYVIAVASHIVNGTSISVDEFQGIEERKRLEGAVVRG